MYVLVLVGLPGSGKTTISRRLSCLGWRCIIQDELGNPYACDDAFLLALQQGHHVVVDRCNVSAGQRAHWLRLAKEAPALSGGIIFVALQLLLPLQLCKERSRFRTGHPTIGPHNADEAIDRLARDFQPACTGEGFERILTVHSSGEAERAVDQILQQAGPALAPAAAANPAAACEEQPLAWPVGTRGGSPWHQCFPYAVRPPLGPHEYPPRTPLTHLFVDLRPCAYDCDHKHQHYHFQEQWSHDRHGNQDAFILHHERHDWNGCHQDPHHYSDHRDQRDRHYYHSREGHHHSERRPDPHHRLAGGHHRADTHCHPSYYDHHHGSNHSCSRYDHQRQSPEQTLLPRQWRDPPAHNGELARSPRARAALQEHPSADCGQQQPQPQRDARGCHGHHSGGDQWHDGSSGFWPHAERPGAGGAGAGLTGPPQPLAPAQMQGWEHGPPNGADGIWGHGHLHPAKHRAHHVQQPGQHHSDPAAYGQRRDINGTEPHELQTCVPVEAPGPEAPPRHAACGQQGPVLAEQEWAQPEAQALLEAATAERRCDSAQQPAHEAGAEAPWPGLRGTATADGAQAAMHAAGGGSAEAVGGGGVGCIPGGGQSANPHGGAAPWVGHGAGGRGSRGRHVSGRGAGGRRDRGGGSHREIVERLRGEFADPSSQTPYDAPPESGAPADPRVILLFDLNGTLTSHTSVRKAQGITRLRPGTEALLRLKQHFRLGIYTSSTVRTVQHAMEQLEAAAGEQLFERRLVLHREHTVPAPPGHVDAGGDPWDTLKPLSRYFSAMHRVILVDDDSYKSIKGEEANMLMVPCWRDGDTGCPVLHVLGDLLLELVAALPQDADVREKTSELSARVHAAAAAAEAEAAPVGHATGAAPSPSAMDAEADASARAGAGLAAARSSPLSSKRRRVSGGGEALGGADAAGTLAAALDPAEIDLD